ncbi:MAG: allantoinase AllB [Leifsonia sp.]|nr:allantoinase AllB [Leifsonia sp.]|tara:strand:+ start:12883 stop:14238 length:1356 start_codon:yes stop_codon:yes gene_type:complete
MTSYDLVIRGRGLIDGTFTDVEIGVTDGTIVAIAEHAPDAPVMSGTETITLAADEVLLPGLVDTHVHINEPGRTEWEGFLSATAAAAAGGVTTVIDMPLNSVPPTTTPENLATKRAAADGQLSVNVGFWGGAVPQNLGHLRELHEAGVFGFKCFLAPSGVPEFGHLDAEQLRAAMVEIAAFDGLLIVHAEDPHVLHDHENAGGAHYADYVASRPDDAEVSAIEGVIAGVRETGCRAHILHLSSAAALPAIRAAKAEGLPLTVETCPHYLSLTSEQVPDAATSFKCAPPIRDAANRDALWEALIDGTIDIIVTDHSPSTAELKFKGDGDFGQAWGGIAGLQLGLSAVWTAASVAGVPLSKVVDLMARATADFARLERKGRLAVGADADLAVFAPDAWRVVDAGELLHKNPVTAYDGLEVRGEVRRTWVGGVAPAAGAGVMLERPAPDPSPTA